MSKRDYYEVLGVEKTADGGTIKSSYRKLALKYHPDRNPDDQVAEDKFKEASEAYEVLSDEQKRATYDRFGHKGVEGQGFSGFNDVNDIFSNFGSIFEDFFGFSGGGGQRARRGADLRYDLTIDFEEAVFGTEKEIEFERVAQCDPCGGSGAKPGTSRKSCQTCGGIGQVRRQQGFFAVATTCPGCRGAGTVVSNPCVECRGQGMKQEQRSINVKIPNGVDEGVRLRVGGEGDQGASGGPAGDLYVVLFVRESETFARDGNNIILEQKVGIAQAALGCRFKVPTLEDEKVIEVPAGTQHGDEVVINGSGIPKLRGMGRGDLIVRMNITVPTKLNKAQKELLKQFADSFGEQVDPKGSGFFQQLFEN